MRAVDVEGHPLDELHCFPDPVLTGPALSKEEDEYPGGCTRLNAPSPRAGGPLTVSSLLEADASRVPCAGASDSGFEKGRQARLTVLWRVTW